MNRLIEKIKSIINVAEKEGENMDDVSWGMQEGILLSYNEAKSIVSFYESIPTPAMVDDGWISFKEKPDKSSRENPIWIASIKNKNVTLGYYDFNYGWFDMNGNGLSCSHWKYPTKPELPPYLTLPNNNQP